MALDTIARDLSEYIIQIGAIFENPLERQVEENIAGIPPLERHVEKRWHPQDLMLHSCLTSREVCQENPMSMKLPRRQIHTTESQPRDLTEC
jgi:hypothetical protein